MRRRIFSHVDVGVSDRNRATAFYNMLFSAMRFAPADVGKMFTSYKADVADDDTQEWFGFTEDASRAGSGTRIALLAESKQEVDRIAALLPEIGARNMEGPDYDYGPSYYAVFFEDPDGNKLELCYLDPSAE